MRDYIDEKIIRELKEERFSKLRFLHEQKTEESDSMAAEETNN